MHNSCVTSQVALIVSHTHTCMHALTHTHAHKHTHTYTQWNLLGPEAVMKSKMCILFKVTGNALNIEYYF